MAKFFTTVSRRSILDIEFENPFADMKIFDILGVESRPMTLKDVPQEFRPYKGCLFDVLGEPDNAVRKQKLTEFFKIFATEGDPGRTCGLLYTIMHLWKMVYMLAMRDFPKKECLKTIDFLIDAGFVDMLMRVLHYCLDKQFLQIEYNRYLVFRIIEVFFAGTQSDQSRNTIFIEKMLEDEPRAVNIFMQLIQGKISWLEQLSACELLGNLSCFDRGVLWLIDNPVLVGEMGTFLWRSYDIIYFGYKQYEDRKHPYHRALLYTSINIKGEISTFKHTATKIADLNFYVTLCAVCNVCAAHPNESTMDRIQPCLVAIVRHGFYWHLGTIAYGILLNQSTYYEPTIEKFLSFLSWSCYNPESQKIILNQIRTLNHSRLDDPLCFTKESYSQSCGVIACLLSHALWLDYENGTHFAINGLMGLLMDDDDVAVEVIKLCGDQLFDLAHSFHHVRMPESVDPLSIKRIVMETYLRLSGGTYYTEKGEQFKPIEPKFKEPVPKCIQDVRDFCERHLQEMKMSTREKQINVRKADAFKTEGNDFYASGEYLGAIECYSKALDICPLTCSERRVTYHSNRAECYLKTNRPKEAIHDCNRALSMNPQNLRARWRRAQAWQNIDRKYPAALDLLTIRRNDKPAKEILGEKVYSKLEKTILDLMNNSNFLDMSIQTYGVTMYCGSLAKNYGLNKFKPCDFTTVPAFRGQSYEEIFGMPPDPGVRW